MTHKSGQVPQITTTLIDHMGSDLSVVNAARVSFGKISTDTFQDLKKVTLS
jgi:hypothetical protein